MSFTKKLNIFLDEALSRGVIENDVNQKLKSFANTYEHKSIFSLINVLSFIGGITIILGSTILAFQNWDKILDIYKIVIYISIVSLLYFLAIILNNKNPITSRVIYFVISGFIFAGVILITQIFEIELEDGNEFLIWFILILPMALILRDRWINTMVVFSFYTWIILSLNLKLFSISHNQFISLITLFCSIILLPKTFTALRESFRSSSFISHLFMGLIIFTMGIFKISFDDTTSEINPMIILLILLNFLCLINNFIRKILLNKKFLNFIYLPESLILSINLIAIFVKPSENQIPLEILYSVIWFWGCGVMIHSGIINRNKSMINFGIWLIAIYSVTRIAFLNKSLLLTGSTYIILGISLIIIGFVAENFRKRIINNFFKDDFIKK